MASNYNVTMNQYNGVDYDTLYPKGTSQQVLLNDTEFAISLGLTQIAPTINDTVRKMKTDYTNIANTTTYNEIVSYVGDGSSGTTKSISFSNIVPKVVFLVGIQKSNGEAVPFIRQQSQTVVYPPMLSINPTNVRYGGFQRIDNASSYQTWYGSKSADGKTVYWHGGNSAAENLNEAGTAYYFMGIQ